MKTRVAVVGLGKMGLMHASIMNMLNDVEVVAICEKNPLVLKFAKKVLSGINIVADLKELSGSGLDAICVTTPPDSHYLIVKTIYEAGISRNIFVEKPLAASYTQAKEMCCLAEAHGGVNMVGHHLRFAVTFGKAKQILDTGMLGDIESFEGYAYSADFLGAKSPKQAIGRGGVLEDSGCHVLDLALWLLGPMEVENARVESIIGKGSEDEAYLSVRTPGGVKGNFGASWCKEGYRLPEMGLTIKGSKGAMKVNQDEVDLEVNGGKSSVWYKHDLNDQVPFSIGGNEYQRQDEMFIRAISDGCHADPSFETASHVQDIIDHVNKYAKGMSHS